MEESINEIKETLKKLSEEVQEVKQGQTELVTLLTEIRDLRANVEEKEKRIQELELKVMDLEKLGKRLDDLELFTRKEDVIISGLAVTPRSYATTLTSGGERGENDLGLRVEEQQTLESQVIQFMRGKGIYLDKNNLAACHLLPVKTPENPSATARPSAIPSIIIRFVNRKHKSELLKQGVKLKGTRVFMNEHLTAKNGAIAKEARSLWKDKKIKGTWTRDCKVLIKTNATRTEAEKVKMIRELSDLDAYR